jgi:hypothetical protein
LAEQRVIATTPYQRIYARAAINAVPAVVSENVVIAEAAQKRVVTPPTNQPVIPFAAIKRIIAKATINRVITRLTINGVIQRVIVRTRRPGIIPRAKDRADTTHYLNSPRQTGVISFHKRPGVIFASDCGMRDAVSLPRLSKIIFISEEIIEEKIY